MSVILLPEGFCLSDNIELVTLLRDLYNRMSDFDFTSITFDYYISIESTLYIEGSNVVSKRGTYYYVFGLSSNKFVHPLSFTFTTSSVVISKCINKSWIAFDWIFSVSFELDKIIIST